MQGIEEEEVVPVVREGEPGGLSSTHLYIILGAVLGLLLLIVIISASVYTCRNKHSDGKALSVKLCLFMPDYYLMRTLKGASM